MLKTNGLFNVKVTCKNIACNLQSLLNDKIVKTHFSNLILFLHFQTVTTLFKSCKV